MDGSLDRGKLERYPSGIERTRKKGGGGSERAFNSKYLLKKASVSNSQENPVQRQWLCLFEGRKDRVWNRSFEIMDLE